MTEPSEVQVDFLLARPYLAEIRHQAGHGPLESTLAIVEILRLIDALVLHERLVMPLLPPWDHSIASDPITGPFVQEGILGLPISPFHHSLDMRAMELTDFVEFQSIDTSRLMAGYGGLVTSLHDGGAYLPPLGVYWDWYESTIIKEYPTAATDEQRETLTLALARVRAAKEGDAIASSFAHAYKEFGGAERALARQVYSPENLIGVEIPPLAAIVLDRSRSLADVGNEALRLRKELASPRARLRELTDVIGDESRSDIEREKAHGRLQEALKKAYKGKAAGAVAALGLAKNVRDVLLDLGKGWSSGVGPGMTAGAVTGLGILPGFFVGGVIGAALKAATPVGKIQEAVRERRNRREVEFLTSIRAWSPNLSRHSELIARVFGVRPDMITIGRVEAETEARARLKIPSPPYTNVRA